MIMHDRHLVTILGLISRSDGAYGWYQIDREITRQGIVSIHVGQALNVLLSQGFVTVSGDPSQATARYFITDQGLRVLAEQKGSGGPEPGDPSASSST
jgi:DNA-binding PadR family transcriptional regulator